MRCKLRSGFWSGAPGVVLETTLAAIAGTAIALFGSFPLVWALELGLRGDGRATIVRGLTGVLVSFATSSILLLGAYLLLGSAFRACGVGFVATLVLVWSIESVRAYMVM